MSQSKAGVARTLPTGPRLSFGTDGWRGVLGDSFTMGNLERITQATVRAMQHSETEPRVVVGHDRRFMAAAHADRVAEVFAGNGYTVLRTDSDLPTPALSGLVVDNQGGFGIMLTASHNPPEYGGFKVKSRHGGSASTQFTQRIESHLDRELPRRIAATEARQRGLWHPVSFRTGYLARLRQRLDIPLLSAAPRMTVVVDSMHGCGDDLIEAVLTDCGHRVITMRSRRDVLFGGQGPEPSPGNLQELRRRVVHESADLGIATDGDADRLAAVDDQGRYLSALHITPLLAHDRLQRCKETGDLARTSANTILLDRIADAWQRPLHLFPIGFKNLVPLMEEGRLLIGGEESGGIGVGRYLPERDGILMGLLLAEMRAAAGRPVSALLAELWETYGEFHYRRQDIPMPAAAGRQRVSEIAASPPLHLAGESVTGVETVDGVKLLLGESGWIMVRPSGTEPLLRLYCEAGDPNLVERLLQDMACTLRV